MADGSDYEKLIQIEDRAEFEAELYKLRLTSEENVKLMMERSNYIWEKYKPRRFVLGIKSFRDMWRLLEEGEE